METLKFDNTIPRTKDGLIKLYIRVVSEKPQYRFDPKKMIFDLLPFKSKQFEVFIPKKDYSLFQSIEDHEGLQIFEHRFINFLMFTDFTQTEIEQIFDAFKSIEPSPEYPIPTIPENWGYSVQELYCFLSSATAPKFSLPLDAADDVPMLSAEDVERLCNEEVEQKEILKKELFGTEV